MREFILSQEGDLYRHWGHIWLGVTAETNYRAKQRIPILLDTPAVHRFVSIEPMLTRFDLSDWLPIQRLNKHYLQVPQWAPTKKISSLEWIIVGGESGPRHRIMRESWVRDVRNQCQAACVPFHFKQFAGFRPEKCPELDGVRHTAVPPFQEGDY